MKVLVSQIGPREHCAVARALHQHGMLATLVTDWYAFGHSGNGNLGGENAQNGIAGRKLLHRCGVLVSRCAGERGRAALAARAEGIPDGLVRAFPFRSLLWKWRVRRLAAQGRLYEAYAQTDAAFARTVARCKLPSHEVFFGYSYASLEAMEAEKTRGVFTVLDQIDPGAAEFRLVADEMREHPEIAGAPPEFPAANFDRNRREWELADLIIVNSEWTRKAIISEGADPGKIEILPLAYEAPDDPKTGVRDGQTGGPERGNQAPAAGGLSSSSPRAASLRVLWLGQVNVRKGIHYLMEAARLLDGENVHFDVVGSIGILPTAVASAPGNMTFHGSVSRGIAPTWYRQVGVFVLPTLSDGFALTQLEALGHGLPVITTPNCGRAVEEGKTGFVVPPRDSRALAAAILRFVRNPGLAATMRHHCLQAVKAFSLREYGEGLLKAIHKHRGRKTAIKPQD